MIEGTSYPCSRVTIEFGGDRLGTATLNGGRFHTTAFSAPGDARPGRTAVTARCSSALEASTTFLIVERAVHRNALVTGLPTPGEVSFSPGDVAKSAAAALVVLPFVFFPFALLEDVMAENQDVIRGWFGFRSRAKERVGWKALPAYAMFSAAAAFLYTWLQPSVGLDFPTLTVFVGILAALWIIVMSEGLMMQRFARRRRLRAPLQALPGSLLVALVVVVLSHLLHFHPGYAFGAVAGYEVAGQLGRRDSGRLAAGAILTIVAVSLAAWVAWEPVSRMAGGPAPGRGIVILETILATTFMVGLETAFVVALPIRFVHGGEVIAWSKGVWAALFGVVAFPTIHTLLTGGAKVVGPQGAHPLVFVVVTVAFALITIGFWAFFRFRSGGSAGHAGTRGEVGTAINWDDVPSTSAPPSMPV